LRKELNCDWKGIRKDSLFPESVLTLARDGVNILRLINDRVRGSNDWDDDQKREVNQKKRGPLWQDPHEFHIPTEGTSGKGPAKVY